MSSPSSDSIRAAIDILRRRWAPAIIEALSEHSCRYLELQRRIPRLSQKVLTEHLRALERAGVVDRAFSADHARVVYSLTSRGKELRAVIAALREWAERG